MHCDKNNTAFDHEVLKNQSEGAGDVMSADVQLQAFEFNQAFQSKHMMFFVCFSM